MALRGTESASSGSWHGFVLVGKSAVFWRARDDYWPATILALAGLVIAAAMALFGLPGVDLHPITHQWGIMDPLCGGTRAARYTMMGELGQAWRYNPLGIVSVLGASVVLVRAGYGLVARRWVTLQFSPTSRTKWLLAAVFVLGFAVLEVRQQGRAELLMARG